jgi:hypothetical protein
MTDMKDNPCVLALAQSFAIHCHLVHINAEFNMSLMRLCGPRSCILTAAQLMPQSTATGREIRCRYMTRYRR